MASVDEILKEYAALRHAGIDKKESLRRLRPHIEPLPKDVKENLVEVIRKFEAGKNNVIEGRNRTTQQVPVAPPPIKPLGKGSSIQKIQPTTNPKVERLYCWNCGKPNRLGEVLCIHCGSMLKQADTAATRQLKAMSDEEKYAFHNESVLFFHVRHNGETIQIRPQDSDHELIIGRADAAGVVIPDVDLSSQGAAQMGVSRMHMTLSYDRAYHQIRVQDMGSANGVYINGQRLVQQEQRVLRDGDQLRLGEMALDVTYQHSS